MGRVDEALTAVASRPGRVKERVNGMWFATGTHDGVTVTAVVRPDGSIAAGCRRMDLAYAETLHGREAEPDMQQWEFHELAHEIVTRFLDRIPAKYVGGFKSVLIGGEYSMAVDDLVLTLVNDQIPGTSDERDDLRRLLEYMKRPTDPLDRLTLVAQD